MIAVRSGAGSDTVDYKLTGPLKVRERIVVDLGRGDDKAAFDFKAGVAATGHLDLVVRGRTGADHESVTMGSIAKSGSAKINLHGGRGDDTIGFRATGTVNGHLFANLHMHHGDHDMIAMHESVGAGGRVAVR